jgi:hypothetical protein
MTAERAMRGQADSAGAWIHRVGAVSALAVGIGYIVIIPLYASVGAPPTGGEAWISYAAGKTAAWWGILGLSVLTDALFIPIALSLFRALEGVARDAMLFAVAFILLFVVLDLAVTWTSYAILITVADRSSGAVTDSQRVADVAAANSASTMLSTTLEGVYSIATLSLGILIAGVVMLRSDSGFGTLAAWLGIATGVLGIVSVVGGAVVSALGAVAILASVLTTIWALVVGARLSRLGWARA